MENQIYIDGQWFDKSKALISVFDHGLLYGDGVFEGIRAYAKNVFKLEEHIQRLYESAHTLCLNIPLDKRQMSDVVVQTLQKNKLSDAYIRLIVTRGSGDLGLDPRKCPKATVIVIADKIALYPKELYENGLAIVTAATLRNHPEAVNPQLKSLNYLNNILAKIEAINAGVSESLMLNVHGYVTECTGENIFLVKGQELVTPPPYVGILKGITRDTVMELAASHGLKVREQVFTRHELYVADEVFLTGTAAEIVPVIKIDNRQIGSGKPGPATASLLKAFQAITSKVGTAYNLS